MTAQREIFVSVDVETAGPVPGEYSLLSIGACDVDNEDRPFSCELKPINRNADPAALKVTGMSLDVLERTGLAPKEGLCCKPDVGVSQIRTTTVLSSCFCVGQTVL